MNTDPLERLLEIALTGAGFDYVTDFGGGNPSHLDFKITGPIGCGVEIEVKQFHSPRIAEQMARADDVIAIQGSVACAFFAYLLACRAAAAPVDRSPKGQDGATRLDRNDESAVPKAGAQTS